MKKILFLSIILSMLIQPGMAAVQQTTSNETIRSEYLNEMFDAYEISFTNTGKNPVQVISIDINNANKNARAAILEKAMRINKQNNKYYWLSIVTFGITGFVGNAKNSTNINNETAALNEAAGYTFDLNSYKGEILVPEMSKTFRILVPKKETPNIQAMFQDTKTNEYIKAE